MIRLPVQVANPSRRKLSDVTLIFQYPRAFALGERRAREMVDSFLEVFPDYTDEMAGTYRFLSSRTVDLDRELATVTYKIGTLLPGDQMLIPEMIEFADRAKCFEDGRFSHTAFGDALKLLSLQPSIRGLCHVWITLHSDLTQPIRTRIDVVSACGAIEDEFQEPIRAYRDAYWLGQPPSGTYYGPRMPFPRGYRAAFATWSPAEFMIPEPDTWVRQKDSQMVVTEMANEDASDVGTTLIYKPGFDVFTLPKGISTEQALLSIGYMKMGRGKH